MSKKDLFRMILAQYFMCYTFTMLATAFFTGLNTPPVTELPESFLWHAGIFSLFAALPAAVYYAKDELTRRQWRIRTIIHTALIEAVLMTAGYALDMYNGVWGAVAFFITVLAVDGAVRLVTYLTDRSTADAINQKLKERRGDGQAR